MFDLVFQILLTTLALTGNQVYELDFRIGTLGEPAPAQLYSYRLAHPFESRVQMTNFAILCASLDWNAARYLPKESPLSGRYAALWRLLPVPAAHGELHEIPRTIRRRAGRPTGRRARLKRACSSACGWRRPNWPTNCGASWRPTRRTSRARAGPSGRA